MNYKTPLVYLAEHTVLETDTLRKSKSNDVNVALPNSSYAFG